MLLVVKITKYLPYFQLDLMISLECNKKFHITVTRFTISSKDILLLLFESSSAVLTELEKMIPTTSKVIK